MKTIKTKDGIVLKNIPADVPDEQIKARIAEIRGGSLDKEFSVSRMVENIPESAGKLAQDMAYPVMHPVDTAKAVGNTALGAAQKLIPGEQSSEVYADAVWDSMKGRYGGWDEIKKTAENDPVGMVYDIAGLFMGGANVGAKMGSKAAQSAAKVSAENVARNAPAIAGNAVKKAVPDSMPASMYESSAKFSTTLPKEQRARMVQTALDEKILPTEKGLNKLNATNTQLMDELDSILTNATEAGKAVSPAAILTKAKSARNKINDITDVDSAALRKQYDKVIKTQADQWKGTESLTPNDVQQFKRNLDKVINHDRAQKTFGGNYRPGAESARMDMRTGAKESLEAIDPKVAELNQRSGRLQELRDKGLERSANRIDNRNIIGASEIGGAVVGGTVGDMKGALGGVVLGGLNDPKLQARLALFLNGLKNSPLKDVYFKDGQIGPALRQALVQMGRTAQSTNQEPR